jgi:GDP-L-fucose synthase
MIKILITGGSGLVGRAIQDVSKMMDEEYIFMTSKDCDLRNYNETLDYFIKIKPDYVIHLACNCGGLFKNLEQKIRLFEDNLLINFNVVKICHEVKIKKLISCLSTCIFPSDTTYPITENMLHNGPPHDSNDGYAYSKRILEIHSRLYREQYNDNFICIIPTNIYGKHDNFDVKDGHVIPALIHKCYLAKQSNQPFVVSGTGKPLRQFIYSTDLAKLILYILYDYKDSGNIILTSNQEVSIIDIATIISNKMNYTFELDLEKPDGQYKKTASNHLLQTLLPDFVFTDIKEGICDTIDWFIDNYDSIRGYQNSYP